MNIRIHPFHPDRAMPEEWQALNDLENQREAEIYPNDPPNPVDYTMRFWHSIPPVVQVLVWMAFTQDGTPAGMATCEMMSMEENRHMAQGRVYVCPALRRQGIGGRLLAEVVRAALANGRRVFISEAIDRIPSGLAFAQRVGGEVGLATHINQLELAQVDRAMLQAWTGRAAERSADFELVFWDGPYPEAELEQLALMMQAMNEAPSGSLDVEDIQWTPDLLRQMDAFNQGRGYGRWSFAARHLPTGDLAGYSEILLPPNKPNVGIQGGTGVLNRYRNRGLGRWLKAAMLHKILADRPNVRFIRTSNADVNEPMLKINHELGFKPYAANSLCQAPLGKLAEYLKEKGLYELA